MTIYETRDYRSFVHQVLKGKNASRPQGSIKLLAEAIGCHPTYVSQVVRENAHFSPEQAIAFCRFAKMDSGEIDFFMELFHKERAGTEELKQYHIARIAKLAEERSNLRKRLKIAQTELQDGESAVFDSWIPQAVHAVCQLSGEITVAHIAKALFLSVDRTKEALHALEKLGVVEKVSHTYHSRQNSIYIGKDSPLIKRLHMNWRQKTANIIQESTHLTGMHYSTLVCLSEKARRRVQEMTMQYIAAAREEILPAPSEQVFVHCLDFYPLVQES